MSPQEVSHGPGDSGRVPGSFESSAEAGEQAARRKLGDRLFPYVQIARVDHWFKNVFVLPGVVVVLFENPRLFAPELLGKVLIALLAAGLVTSSNYVLNEVLDGPRDALHPVKRNRPVPAGRVYIPFAYLEWLVLAAAGLAVSALLGRVFLACAAALVIMGCIYNVPPIRSKDRPYVDVLSESVNNPLRLLLGWYATGTTVIPTLSLIMAYWMLGAFFMAVKRFAEYRRIGDPGTAGRYRGSFVYYNQERLLVSIVYYAAAFGLFFGIFLIRYRIELLLSVPFLAGFMAMYIHLGYKDDSPVQYPERLYKQKSLIAYMVFCLALLTALMFVDIPWLADLFQPTLSHHTAF